jgi:hypothetical protein
VPAVADHQSAAGLVTLPGELGYVLVHLRLQSGGQHPPSTLTDDLVNQGTGLGGAVFVDYAEYGRAFPTRVRSAGLLGDLTITHSGRYALRTSSRGADPHS